MFVKQKKIYTSILSLLLIAVFIQLPFAAFGESFDTLYSEDFENGTHTFSNVTQPGCVAVAEDPTGSANKALKLSAAAETVMEFDQATEMDLSMPVTFSGKFLAGADKTTDTYWDIRVSALTDSGKTDIFSITDDCVWRGAMGSGQFTNNDWGIKTWYDFSLKMSLKAAESNVVVCELSVAGIPYSAYEIAVDGLGSGKLFGLHFLSVQKNTETYLDDLKIVKTASKPAGYIYGEDFENVETPFTLTYGRETTSVVTDPINSGNKVLRFQGKTDIGDVSWHNKNVEFDLSSPVTLSGRLHMDRQDTEYWSLHMRPLVNGGNINPFFVNNDGLTANGTYLGAVQWDSGWNNFSVKMSLKAANTIDCTLTINNYTYPAYTITDEKIGSGQFIGLQIWNQEFGETSAIYLDDLKLARASAEGFMLNSAKLTDKNGTEITVRSQIDDSLKATFNVTNYGELCTLTPALALYQGDKLLDVSLGNKITLATGVDSGEVTVGFDSLPATDGTKKLDVKLLYWDMDAVSPIIEESSWNFGTTSVMSLYVDGRTEGGNGSFDAPFFPLRRQGTTSAV